MTYQNYSLKRLNNSLIEHCEQGDLATVKYLLISPDLKKHANIHTHEGQPLRESLKNNHLELAKYLLSSPELTVHADIHVQYDQCLLDCCARGYLDLVKFLLTAPELTTRINVNTRHHESLNHESLRLACKYGHLEIVKYLLSSAELTQRADINREAPILEACYNGHVEIVKYLFSSPELLSDMSNLFNPAVQYACRYPDLMKYFIFELRLPLTEHIESFLQTTGHTEFLSMFKLRDEHEQLNDAICDNPVNKTKRIKI